MRLFLGRSEVSAASDGMWRIPLLDGSGNWIIDAFDWSNITNNGIPKGSYLVVRLGGGQVRHGQYGFMALVSIAIMAIQQDEPTGVVGSGNTCPDAGGVGTSQAWVLAERTGTQNGRVYQIFFRADDRRGGSCTGSVTAALVPHDQGRNGAAADSGVRYDSTVCNGPRVRRTPPRPAGRASGSSAGTPGLP